MAHLVRFKMNNALSVAFSPLFGAGIRPLEEKDTKCLCCTCTRKRLITLLIICVMLLLYGIGLAIGKGLTAYIHVS